MANRGWSPRWNNCANGRIGIYATLTSGVLYQMVRVPSGFAVLILRLASDWDTADLEEEMSIMRQTGERRQYPSLPLRKRASGTGDGSLSSAPLESSEEASVMAPAAAVVPSAHPGPPPPSPKPVTAKPRLSPQLTHLFFPPPDVPVPPVVPATEENDDEDEEDEDEVEESADDD
jgi:hypothetical protein